MASESTSCLDPDTLVELLEGRADDATYARALAHASTCEACRNLLSALAREPASSSAPISGDGITLVDLGADSKPPTVVDAGKAAPSRPSGLDVGQLVDRYELVRLIGAGGMGYVYAARDPDLDRTVALKLLRPDLGSGDAQLRLHERLRREAQAMAQLAHPNVISVYDVGAFADRVFVAMEYIEGDTLAHWAVGKTPREILDAYIAAGRGLAAAHAAGLVHRDFKPENVLVGTDGRARVGDFGLARTLDKRVISKRPDHGAERLDLTRTGLAIGTPLYMAPEQFAGETVDSRSDQFSFCVALHGALYGTRPFAGDTFEDLAQTVLAGQLSEPTTKVRVSRRVRAAIRRGLSLHPQDRWASMDALLAELQVRPMRWPWLVVPTLALAAIAITIAVLWRSAPAADAPPCDRDYFAKDWTAERKHELTDRLEATKLPYAKATAAAVVRAGDRFTTEWTQLRVGSCKAYETGELKTDAYALQNICLTLRHRDFEALVARLAAITPDAMPRAAFAFDSLVPIDICRDRAMLQLLVGPPDAKARRAINRVINELHDVRAVMVLAEPSMRDKVIALVDSAQQLTEWAVVAEVLDVAGRYAASIGDLAHARTWLKGAVHAAELGRHDLAGASAAIALVEVDGTMEFPTDDTRQRADVEAMRRDRPELTIANALVRTRNMLPGETAEAIADNLVTAAATADRSYAADDTRRVRVHVALAAYLAQAGRADDARRERTVVDKLLHELVGDDHPLIARVIVDESTRERDPVVATAQLDRAEAIATHAKDRDALAEVIAARARRLVDAKPADAATLYAKAIALDGASTSVSAIARLGDAVAAAKADAAASLPVLDKLVAKMRAAWAPESPRLHAAAEALARITSQ